MLLNNKGMISIMTGQYYVGYHAFFVFYDYNYKDLNYKVQCPKHIPNE